MKLVLLLNFLAMALAFNFMSFTKKSEGESKIVKITVGGDVANFLVTHWPAKSQNLAKSCNIIVPYSFSPSSPYYERVIETQNDHCDLYKLVHVCHGFRTEWTEQCPTLDRPGLEILSELLWFNPEGLKLQRGTKFFSEFFTSNVVDGAYELIVYLRDKDIREDVGSMSYFGGLEDVNFFDMFDKYMTYRK